jgi:dihydroneopterin aldolase/2-amino-4-hydroxy-6-hydroxymethyldihydropteridine diphosphokinase
LVGKEKSTCAFIGIGSNLGDKEKNIEDAIRLISESGFTKIVKISSLYKTEPVGYVKQDWFVNAVIKVKTKLSPKELLDSLSEIEKDLGRERVKKWGPRIIDLDILFYDKLILNEEGVTIPHPHLHERNFVLKPFCKIEPEFIHPILNKSILMLYNELQKKEKVIKIQKND